MLTRALLYTAVTRAQKFVYCLGQSEMLERAARNRRGSERRTALQEKLTGNTPAAPSEALSAEAMSALL